MCPDPLDEELANSNALDLELSDDGSELDVSMEAAREMLKEVVADYVDDLEKD